MTATITPIGRAAEPMPHVGSFLSPRVEAMMEAQRALAYSDGERDGYWAGLRWGSVSWIVIGLIAGALLRHVLGPLT